MTESKVRVAVSWFCIITVIVLSQLDVTSRSSDEQTEDSAAIMQIQLTGKYFIGIKHLVSQNPMMGGVKNLDQAEQGILKILDSSKHLSSIPILTEFFGKDAALKELDRMASDPDNIQDSKNIPVFYQLYNDGSNSLDSKQLTTLKEYGWIGRLALSQDKPDTDPERKAVLNSALQMFIFMALFIMTSFAALVGGLVLFIIAIVQVIMGNFKSHILIQEKPGILLLETLAIFLVLSAILPRLFMNIMPDLLSGSILVSVLAGIISILWPLLQGAEWKDYRISIGWHRGKGIFREIGAGIVGYITGLPLMVIAVIIVLILVKYAGEAPSHPVVYGLSRSPFFLFLLACVYAPIVEETLFRGALYCYLRRSLSWVVSAAISSFIFAILHPQGWVAVPALGVIGFNLSAIREWRGSAIASMTAHALNNGVLILLLVITLS